MSDAKKILYFICFELPVPDAPEVQPAPAPFDMVALPCETDLTRKDVAVQACALTEDPRALDVPGHTCSVWSCNAATKANKLHYKLLSTHPQTKLIHKGAVMAAFE